VRGGCEVTWTGSSRSPTFVARAGVGGGMCCERGKGGDTKPEREQRQERDSKYADWKYLDWQ